MEKGSLHRTEFGLCEHDYTMSPCEKYRDCGNCTEHLCIKGDKKSFERIKRRLQVVEEQYAAAKKAIADGKAGADRWFEYHKLSRNRLRELVLILENPAIPDGAQIKLQNENAFSPLRRAVESRVESAKLKNQKDEKLITDMKRLLGGGLG